MLGWPHPDLGFPETKHVKQKGAAISMAIQDGRGLNKRRGGTSHETKKPAQVVLTCVCCHFKHGSFGDLTKFLADLGAFLQNMCDV